jgi:hypothetical protein
MVAVTSDAADAAETNHHQDLTASSQFADLKKMEKKHMRTEIAIDGKHVSFYKNVNKNSNHQINDSKRRNIIWPDPKAKNNTASSSSSSSATGLCDCMMIIFSFLAAVGDLDEIRVLGPWAFTLQPDTPIYWLKAPDVHHCLIKARKKFTMI